MEKLIELDNFVCRYYYASGRCSDGDNCHFPHEIGKNRIPDNFCRFNFEGKCCFNNLCYREHATIFNHAGKKVLQICPKVKSDNSLQIHQFSDIPRFSAEKLVDSEENLAGAVEGTAANPESIYLTTEQDNFQTNEYFKFQSLLPDNLTRPQQPNYGSLMSIASGQTSNQSTDCSTNQSTNRADLGAHNSQQGLTFPERQHKHDFVLSDFFPKPDQRFFIKNKTSKNRGLITRGVQRVIPCESQQPFAIANTSRESTRNFNSGPDLKDVSGGGAYIESPSKVEDQSTSPDISKDGIDESDDRSPFKGENFSFFTDHCIPCCTPSNRCRGDFTTRSSNPPPPSDNQDYNRNMRYHTSPFTLGLDISFLDSFSKDNQGT